MDPLEEVWKYREETIYPQWFGDKSDRIFVLESRLFTEVFGQKEIDPLWLHHGVIEIGPTEGRNSWVYVSSGLSNPWDTEPGAYASSEVSGLGTELVLETPEQASWAIVALQRLVAFQTLLGWGRFGDRPLISYGDRIPLRGPITPGKKSELSNIVVAEPKHYEPSFRLKSGHVEFLHMLGVSDAELAHAKNNGTAELVDILSAKGVYPLTDPTRRSVL